jgi:hypothetical protein
VTSLATFRTSSLTLGLVAVAIVLTTVYLDVQDISPGQVSAVHAQHAGLAGTQNCQACHGRAGQSMASACLSCHEDIHLQLDAQNGFHGNLQAELASDCAICHSEHHGKEFAVTNARSFALSGVPDSSRFQHQGLNFCLQGKHLSIGCETCHPNANVDLLPMGEKRFLGLGQSCTSCHRDVHDGGYGQDCASCHGQQHPFPRVAEFVHTKAFELAGSHGKAACVSCHPPDSPHRVETLISASSPALNQEQPVRSCRECHQSPHKELFLAAIADQLDLLLDDSCQHCHPAVHESFVGSDAMFDKRLHDHTGFALETPHNNIKCESCHAGFGEPKPQLDAFRQSFPGRRPDDCQACHQDPHQGQFEQGRFRGADCLTCHRRHTFAPSAFGIDYHAQTRFPLLGKHQAVACNDCHRLATGRQLSPQTDGRYLSALIDASVAGSEIHPDFVRVFHGTSTACKDCHEDPHQGQFESGPFRQGDCRTCHDEQSFLRPTFTIDQHAATQFELTGAHSAVACNSCHLRPGETPDGRLADGPNQPRVFHGTPAQCVACHDDVHQGQFDQPHLPQVVDGNTGCARCHTTESFGQVRATDFDHAKWAGYELSGAHARAQCADCHARSDAADRHRASFGRVAGRDCQSCHRDPHVGQFGPTANVNCSQCHVVGNSFGELVFDHQQHSQFQLDRDHAKLACAACHKPQPLPDGSTAIRYKPLGTQCGDCHVAVGPRSRRLRGQR